MLQRAQANRAFFPFELLRTRDAWAELMLTAFLLNALLNSGGVYIIFGGNLDARSLVADEGNAWVQVIYSLFFIGSIAISSQSNIRQVLYAVPISFVIVLIWCWLSLLWAIAPEVAVRRVILETIVIFSIFNLVSVAGPERSLRSYVRAVMVSIPLYVTACLTISAAVVSDVDSANAWRGLSIDKNYTGAIAANAAIVLIYRMSSPKSSKSPAVTVFCFILAIILLVKSGSKTSVAVYGIALIGGALLVICTKNALVALTTCIGVAGLCLGSWLFAGDIYASFSDIANDPTAFTGRIQIWSPLVDYLSENLWFGSGYGSFWSIGDDSPILQYARGYLTWLRTVPNGHNGYIDMAIQTGMVGVVLMVTTAFIVPLFKTFRKEMSSNVRWLISGTIIFASLHNLLEATLFNKAPASWLMFLVIIAVLHNVEKNASEDSK